MKKKILSGILNLFLLSSFLHARQNESILDYTILLQPGKYTLEQLIETLNNSNLVIVSCDANTIPVKAQIKITSEAPSIRQILNEIQKTLPVDYQVRDKLITLKRNKPIAKNKISGRVIDAANGEPMESVDIYTKDGNEGVTSNSDGRYTLNLKTGNYKLVFSYTGYKKEVKEIFIDGDMELNISLSQIINTLEEVKIISKPQKYYSLDIGRPMETVSMKEIERVNTSNASDILHARLSGVWATQTSGLPGDHEKIRIRGVSSLFGCADPLYVIDGVSVPTVNLNSLGIADLNVNDIESITILKDASSTALFGYQGGNGVVLINTKHDNVDCRFNFIKKTGIQWFSKRYDLMDTKDFLATIQNCDKTFKETNLANVYPSYSSSLSNVDWQNWLFRPGLADDYQLSGSGVFKNTNYYISGNYSNNDGIIRNTSYKRYTLSVNANRNFNKNIYFEAGYRGSYQQNRNNLDSYGGNPLLIETINKAPCILSVPDSMNTYTNINGGINSNQRTIYNYPELQSAQTPNSLVNNLNKGLDVLTNTIRGSAKITLAENLNINAASDLSFRNNDYLSDIHRDYTYQLANNYPADKYLKSNENIVVADNQIHLDWQKKINDHEFKINAGLKYYVDNVYWHVDSTTVNFNNLEPDNNTLTQDDEVYIRNSLAIHGTDGSVIRRIRSYLGNLSYNYKNKYFVSMATNYEKLTEGYISNATLFPSIALDWDAAMENGINKFKPLNHFNFYASWGRSGNYPLNGLSNDLYESAQYGNGNSVTNGLYISQLGNHGLKEELIEEYNFGSKIDLFNNSRIKAEADVYFKTSSNLIIQRDVPLFYGGGKFFFNIAEMSVKGKEFTLELIPIIYDGFAWYTKFNFSTFNQRITKLTGNIPIPIKNYDVLDPNFIIKENSGLGDIYGLKCLGIWTSANNINYTQGRVDDGGMIYLTWTNNILL